MDSKEPKEAVMSKEEMLEELEEMVDDFISEAIERGVPETMIHECANRKYHKFSDEDELKRVFPVTVRDDLSREEQFEACEGFVSYNSDINDDGTCEGFVSYDPDINDNNFPIRGGGEEGSGKKEVVLEFHQFDENIVGTNVEQDLKEDGFRSATPSETIAFTERYLDAVQSGHPIVSGFGNEWTDPRSGLKRILRLERKSVRCRLSLYWTEDTDFDTHYIFLVVRIKKKEDNSRGTD